MPNQHRIRKHLFPLHKESKLKSCVASLEELEPHILEYWSMRVNDKEMLGMLLENNIDRTRYTLG
jgi:hypothetical protein